MRKLLSALLLIALLATIITPTRAMAHSPSELETKIDNFVAEHQDKTAAVSIAVFTHQDTLFEQAYGYINMSERVANSFDAVFEWGSAGKLLVYVSAFQLVERGLLDLHTDIRTMLPEGFFTGLRYDEPITMMHLLNHQAGFQELFLGLIVADESQVLQLGEFLRRYQPPQIFRPGERVAYSNFSTALAGFIIEIISGKPFYAYVHENIFAPLGMDETALRPCLSDNMWVREQRVLMQCYTTDLRSLGNAPFIVSGYPAGKATGTISDFRIFAQALLPDENGTSPLFENPETLSSLYTPTVYQADGTTGRIYHGFLGYSHLAGYVLGHAGGTLGMSANLLIDIENDFGVVVLTNQRGEVTYNWLLMQQLFGQRDFSEINNEDNDVRINGIFYDARGFERGIFRVINVISIRPLFHQADGSLSIPFFGTVQRVAPGVFSFEGVGFAGTLLFANRGEETPFLTGSTSDWVRVSWGQAIFEIVSILLFAIGGLIGLVALIRILIAKIRKKELPFSKPQVFLYATSLLAVLNLVLFILTAASLQITMTATTIHGLLFMLSAIAIAVFIVLAALHMKAQDLTKKQKRRHVFSFFIGAIVIVNVVYWQLYMFWV